MTFQLALAFCLGKYKNQLRKSWLTKRELMQVIALLFSQVK